MQDVVKALVNNGTSGLGNFGTYVNSISTPEGPRPECLGLDETDIESERRFGWKIDFNLADKGLGVYARLSNKGIEGNYENIMRLDGTLKEPEEDVPIEIYIPVNTVDQYNNEIDDPKKQYIIHDRYMRLDAYGNCSGTECPNPGNGMYSLNVLSATVHLRISFKSVPDFINLPFDANDFNYDEFTDIIYNIVKVFDKDAAKTVKNEMQDLTTRVTGFGAGENCPLSPNYVPTTD